MRLGEETWSIGPVWRYSFTVFLLFPKSDFGHYARIC
jgi:hypothetical protein